RQEGREDAEKAEGEEGVVKRDGIGRVETSQPVRDLSRGFPVSCLAARQAEAARHQMDMRICRNHEAVWRNSGPKAEIERVAAHHPAEIEIPALTGGTLRGVGKEKSRR